MHQLHLQSIGRHLSYLVISIVLYSCWNCRCQDTMEPIRRQYTGLREYDSLLQEIPRDIQAFPRLIIGQTPSFAPTAEIERRVLENMGCIVPRKQDMILDQFTRNQIVPGGPVNEEMLDIISRAMDGYIAGDAWDPGTIAKIQAHDRYKAQGALSAIVFERVGVLPLYWGKYLQAFVAQPTHEIYKFPDRLEELIDYSALRARTIGASDFRLDRKQFYEDGYGSYRDLQEIPLSTLQLPSIYQVPNLVVDPRLVTVTNTQDGLFQKEESRLTQPQLEQLINSPVPAENTILKGYYELLAPGGLLIFSSSANAINRYGGIVVEHRGKHYTPFKDLDDPNMQAVYRSVFERAGFVDIQFYQDPYFAENVILLVAKKP